jgi:hypothetical protein
MEEARIASLIKAWYSRCSLRYCFDRAADQSRGDTPRAKTGYALARASERENPFHLSFYPFSLSRVLGRPSADGAGRSSRDVSLTGGQKELETERGGVCV